MASTITKPPYGSPCNSCGVCCERAICPLGEITLKTKVAPCPAIVKLFDGKMQCGLIVFLEIYFTDQCIEHGAADVAKAAHILNGAGLGCDCGDQDDFDQEQQGRMFAASRKLPIAFAKKVLGL